MKKINALLLTTILVCFALFSFTGCEDKKVQEPLMAAENTTEIFTQKDKDQPEEQKEEAEIKKEPISEENITAHIPEDAIILNDIQQNRHIVTIDNQQMTFHDISQSIVIINFFSTWSSPCRGEIPYLSDLQKKYKKDLFIAGILINDVLHDQTLKEFISKYHANYFISNSKRNDAFASKIAKELQLPENFSTPLTVIYKDGDYYTHYEGAVPVEMIDHDIQQAIKE